MEAPVSLVVDDGEGDGGTHTFWLGDTLQLREGSTDRYEVIGVIGECITVECERSGVRTTVDAALFQPTGYR